MRNIVRIMADHAQIEISKKENTYICYVDLDDLERLKELNISWKANVDRYGKVYADGSLPRNGQKQKKVLMHRYLLNFPEGLVDHINHDTLDNRKNNLRVVDYIENGQNLKTISKNNTTGYLNVTRDKRWERWRVQIRSKGKLVFHKSYEDLQEARQAAKEAREKYLPKSKERLSIVNQIEKVIAEMEKELRSRSHQAKHSTPDNLKIFNAGAEYGLEFSLTKLKEVIATETIKVRIEENDN